MVEVNNEVGGIDITFILPGIFFIFIPFPLDEEFQLIILHMALKHLFHLKMFFTFMENRRGGGLGFWPGIGSFREGVSLMTGKTGCRLLKIAGRHNFYVAGDDP
jgi:hypothetical protein